MKKRLSANPSLARTFCRRAIPLLGAVLLPGLALGAGPDRGALEVGSRVPGEVGVGRVLTRTFGDGAGVLAVQVGEDFQPGSLEVEPRPEVKLVRGGGSLTAVVARPDWVEELIAARMSGGGGLAAGMVGSASAALPEGASGRVRLVAAVALEEPGSAVEVRLVDGSGRVVKTLEAAASQPVRWRADLGEVASARLAGSSRLEITVLRGRASGTLAGTPRNRRGGGYVRPIAVKSLSGSGSFNHSINWAGTGDLYYYVTGGPASTCGDLTTYRNGSWLVTSGWLCTDSSGNATKGPWSWSSTPSDQTDDPAYIAWPDGSQTTSATHIWDKTCATTHISSAGLSTFSGSASDAQWGAGFDSSWTSATCTYDDSNGHYWGPGLSGYTSSSPISVNATVSGMPGFSVTWSCPTPSTSAQIGVLNHWTACVTDGGCGICDEVYFSINP